MQAIPAPLLFFMTSEMTEKFFTIAPTNTFRKMNAPASGGAAIVSVKLLHPERPLHLLPVSSIDPLSDACQRSAHVHC
jgi:hypothetical protein